MAIEQIAPLDGFALMALAVPAGSRVLVVRSANGAPVDARLAERNCKLTHALSVAEADAEDFDAVVIADGFESLPDPVATLRDATKLVGADGVVVFSVANAASSHARIAAFLGGETGDGVPQRRYDLSAIQQVVGLAEVAMRDTLRVFDETDLPDAPGELLALAGDGPDAHTAAFVLVVGARRDTGATGSLSEALQAQVEAAAQKVAEAENARAQIITERDELAARVRDLEAELAHAAKLRDELRNDLSLREDALLERIEMVERLQTERKHLELDIAVKNDYIADLRTDGQHWKDLHGALLGEHEELLRSRHYKLAKLMHQGLKQIPFLHGTVKFVTRVVMRSVRRNAAP